MTSITGIVTIVQESRFQLTDDGGVGHFFVLGRNAACEPAQLTALQHGQTRIHVTFRPAGNLVGSVATSIKLAQ